MRRFLLILLMVIVPAQAAVAAVCTYCDHLSDDASGHVLVHGKAAIADVDCAGDPSAWQSSDAECALCHLGSASLITAFDVALSAQHPNAPLPHRVVAYDPSHLERIERVPLAVADSF